MPWTPHARIFPRLSLVVFIPRQVLAAIAVRVLDREKQFKLGAFAKVRGVQNVLEELLQLLPSMHNRARRKFHQLFSCEGRNSALSKLADEGPVE